MHAKSHAMTREQLKQVRIFVVSESLSPSRLICSKGIRYSKVCSACGESDLRISYSNSTDSSNNVQGLFEVQLWSLSLRQREYCSA